MKTVRYIVVTPLRNELEHFPKTIASMVTQTIRPACWVLVDDGSSDGTGRLVDEAAQFHPWVRAVHRADRGFRRAGGGVMEAFFDGLERVRGEQWDFLVKLDGDLSFEADYFERCLGHFAAESRLGIGGGVICNPVNGELCPESEVDPPFHVRGATKIYRQACWQAIGGLTRAAGWDTVDEVKANMLGWSTRTFPDIKLIHHRLAGEAYGTWANWVKNGQASYFAGYHPIFMLGKCFRRFFQKPRFIGGLGLAAGYFKGPFCNPGRVKDPDLIRYFHRQQMLRLLGRRSLWG